MSPVKGVFLSLAKPIERRVANCRDLLSRLDRVDGSKVATLVDLDECFFADNHIEHLGFAGAEHLLKKEALHKALQHRVDAGMFLEDIPASLARPRTADVLHHHILNRMVMTPGSLPKSQKAVQQVYLKEKSRMPSRLQLVYVGDYLETVQKVEALRLNLVFDSLSWNAAAAQEIVQNFHNLEDYRDLFPRRPPRNGTKRRQPDMKTSPVLKPVWA